MITYVVAIVLVAFIFDFSNGFHDSANSIATIVGTRVLSPLAAVIWAAIFNFAELLAAFDPTTINLSLAGAAPEFQRQAHALSVEILRHRRVQLLKRRRHGVAARS